MPIKKNASVPKNSAKRPARKSAGRPVRDREVEQLENEVSRLRDENRRLRKSLGALICKDDPMNLDLTPADGVFDPPLTELIAEIERAGS